MWAKLKNLSAIFLVALLTLSSPSLAKKKPIFDGSVSVVTLVHNHNDIDLLLSAGKDINGLQGPTGIVLAETKKLFQDVDVFSLESESQLLMLVYLGYGPDIELGMRASSDGYEGKQAIHVLLVDSEGNALANIKEGHRSTKKAIQKAISKLKKRKLKKQIVASLAKATKTNWLLAYNPDISEFRPINQAVEIQITHDLQYLQHSISPTAGNYHDDPYQVAHALLEAKKPALFKKFTSDVDLSTGVHAAARGVPAEKVATERFYRRFFKEQAERGVSSALLESQKEAHTQVLEAEFPEPEQTPYGVGEVVDRNNGVTKVPGIPSWERETLFTRAIKTGQSKDVIDHILNLDWYKNTNMPYEPNWDAKAPINLAFEHKRLDLIEGLDVNITDSRKFAAAHFALWYNDIPTYLSLKEKGANPDLAFLTPQTKLPWLTHMARHQKWEVLRYLAENKNEAAIAQAETILQEFVYATNLPAYAHVYRRHIIRLQRNQTFSAPQRLRVAHQIQSWAQLSEEEFTRDFPFFSKIDASGWYRELIGGTYSREQAPSANGGTITPAQAKADTIITFLELGVDPNLKLKYGDTLLHWAARSHQDALITYLGSVGADANALDSTGRSPIFDAFPPSLHDITERDEKTIQALVNIGANLDHKDSDGNTAFDAYINEIKSYKMEYAKAQFDEKKRLAEEERNRQLAEIRRARAAENRRIEQEHYDRQRADERRANRENMQAILRGFSSGVSEALGEYQRNEAREAYQQREDRSWAREMDYAREQAAESSRQAELEYQREQEQLARDMREIRDRLWQRHAANGGSYDFSKSSQVNNTSQQSPKTQAPKVDCNGNPITEGSGQGSGVCVDTWVEKDKNNN